MTTWLFNNIRNRWYFLLAFLPLLGSLYTPMALRAEQARLVNETPPMPLPASQPAPLAVAWARDLGGSGLYGGMAEGLVFAARDGAVAAFDETTGEIVWSQPIDAVGALALVDGILVVHSGSSDLYSLDPGSGATLWHRAQLRASFGKNVVVAQRSAEDRRLAFLDPARGQALWEVEVPVGTYAEALAKVVDGENRPIVLVRDGERLVALNGQDGRELWRAELSMYPHDMLLVNGEYLVYEASDGRQFCTLRLADGWVAWCHSLMIVEEYREWPVMPAFDEDVVLLKVDRYTLAGMALDSGQTLWTFAPDEPREPITYQSYRPTELDAADGSAYFALGDQKNVAYAVDSHSGQLLWRAEALNLFDIEILAHDQDELFFRHFQPNEAEILVVSKKSGQLLGRVASGTAPDPVPVKIGSFARQAPIGVTIDERGFLLYGEARSVTAPGIPNLLVSPRSRLLVRFAPAVDPEALAARSRDWWGAGDRASAWYTLDIALRNSGRLAPDSPLAQACQTFLEAELADMQTSFAGQNYRGVLDQYTGGQARFVFHPLARSCPGGEDWLAQGYLLAGEAHAIQSQGKARYQQPLENPYYRQLMRDLPDSRQAGQALARLAFVRQAFTRELWQQRRVLIGIAVGAAFFFSLVYKLIGRGSASRPAAALMLFNLTFAGPVLDITALASHASNQSFSYSGANAWHIWGAIIAGLGFILALLTIILTSPTDQPTRKVSTGALVVFWILDSMVMVIAVASVFPRSLG